MQDRFQDQNYRLTHFQEEVAVVCPKCNKKARATVDYEEKNDIANMIGEEDDINEC